MLSLGLGAVTHAATTITSPVAGVCLQGGVSGNIVWTWDDAAYDHASLSYDAGSGSVSLGHPASTPHAITVPTVTADVVLQVESHDVNHAPQSTGTVAFSVDSTGPSASNLLMSSRSSNQINLAWTASTDPGCQELVGYKLYRDGVLIYTGTATSFADSGLSPSTSYSYRVDAYDAYVTTAGSAQSLATADPVPTAEPSTGGGSSGGATTPPSSVAPTPTPTTTTPDTPTSSGTPNQPAQPQKSDDKPKTATEASQTPVGFSTGMIIGIGLLLAGTVLAVGSFFWVRKPPEMI